MNEQEFKEQYREVSRVLEKHHAIFYQMWEYGTPVLTDSPSIATACLRCDPKSYKPLQFCFNSVFWESLDINSRAFVVGHECLHAILNHGKRSKAILENGGSAEAVNIALDVAVNHMLVASFGFNRETTAVAEEACWVDTVFPDKDVSSNLAFEEYYNLLLEEQEKNEESEEQSDNSGEEKGEGRKSKVKRFDDHSQLGNTDIKDIIQKLAEDVTDYDIQTMNDKIQSFGRGNDILGSVETPLEEKIRPSKKWESLVKKWKRIGYNPPDETEMWTKLARRGNSLPGDIILPIYDYSDDDDFAISKLNDWTFLDVSGSCKELKEVFFMAYDSIPEKRFNKRMFVFADSVLEVSKRGLKENVGHGTSFVSLANFVKSEINRSGVIPDVIRIITDGDSSHENCVYVYPERWHWFLDNPYEEKMKTMDSVDQAPLIEKFKKNFNAIPISMKKYLLVDYFKK